MEDPASIGIIICDKFKLPVKPMKGITVVPISANLESTCLHVERRQHAACYECLGRGKFPVKEINDDEEAGNEQGQREDYSNLGVKEVVHPSMPFQCEDCWMYHL